jgi:hypothetical protein
MNADSIDNNQRDTPTRPGGPPRAMRYVRAAAIAAVVISLCLTYALGDHIRTLRSLRQIPGTNAYVMDYYVDYNIERIRSQGMDVKNVEDGLIDVFFPDVLAAIARRAKGRFIQRELEVISPTAHRCSTLVLRSGGGDVFFGRNFDWMHDACLIVKVHQGDAVASIAVIDLHYLDLDRPDLESTSLIERIPLLFAPYYLQDGMNRNGLAVSDMSVDDVQPPFDKAKPNVLHSTAMRLILDYAKTVDEAVELLRQFNIHFGETTGHLMIADASGTSCVVEFIGGEIKVTQTNDSWQVCTNHRIAGKSETENDEHCDRYRLASGELAALSSSAGAGDVMQIMESVAQKQWTMWTSVYNLSTGELQFAYRQHYGSPYHDSLEGPR